MEYANEDVLKPRYRPTLAVDRWILSGRRSKAKALREAGYSEAVARHPEKVFGSRVVQELMRRAGIKERIEFKPIKNDDRETPDENFQLQFSAPYDFSKMSKESAYFLKILLDATPDSPTEAFSQKETETSSYTPEGEGIDLFSAEAKWCKSTYPSNPQFSSM